MVTNLFQSHYPKSVIKNAATAVLKKKFDLTNGYRAYLLYSDISVLSDFELQSQNLKRATIAAHVIGHMR